MIRLMFVDDHDMVRRALCEFLGMQPDVRVVAEAASSGEMLEKLRSIEVDLLVLDLQMPGMSGVEVVKCVRNYHPSLPVLVLSAHSDAPTVSQVMKAGATGFVPKSSAPEVLLEGIRSVVSKGKFLPPDMAERVAFASIGNESDDVRDILSEREMQVFERVVAGKPIKEIAADLFISDKTVSTHKAHLLEKLGLHSVPDLVRYAMQRDLFK